MLLYFLPVIKESHAPSLLSFSLCPCLCTLLHPSVSVSCCLLVTHHLQICYPLYVCKHRHTGTASSSNTFLPPFFPSTPPCLWQYFIARQCNVFGLSRWRVSGDKPTKLQYSHTGQTQGWREHGEMCLWLFISLDRRMELEMKKERDSPFQNHSQLGWLLRVLAASAGLNTRMLRSAGL